MPMLSAMGLAYKKGFSRFQASRQTSEAITIVHMDRAAAFPLGHRRGEVYEASAEGTVSSLDKALHGARIRCANLGTLL